MFFRFCRFPFSSWKTKKPKKRPMTTRRLILEALESRLAPAVTTSFNDGLLTISCDDAGNQAILTSDGGGNIALNGAALNGVPNVSSVSQISILGGNGDDVIDLSGLTGFTGSASLDGGAGNDALVGGPGANFLTGGLGDDTMTGGPGTNRLIELGNVNFTLSDTSLTGLGTDVLVNIQQAQLACGTGANIIDASAFTGNTTLQGGAGNDKITGGAGDDRIVGGLGNDQLSGGGGVNTYITKAGKDTLIGTAVTATVSAGMAPVVMGTPDAPKTITIGESATPVTLSFGSVSDVSIDSKSAIQTLTAIEWLNSDASADVIKAPSIGVLSITGSKADDSSGDFQAGLELSGASGNALTLKAATIKGAITDGTWNIDGKGGAVTADSTAANWSANFTGTLNSFTTAGDSAGTVAAASFGNVTIKRDLDGGFILAGANLGADGRRGGTGDDADTFAAGSINKLTILRDALGVTVAAGVDPVDGIYHNSNDTVIGGSGSAIKVIFIGHSASLDSYFRAGKLPANVKIGGVNVNPLNDARFKDAPPITFHAFAFTGAYPTAALVSYTDNGNSVQVLAYPGQVQVFAVPTTSESAMHDLIEANSGAVIAQVPYLGYYLVSITPGTEAAFITTVSGDASVLHALPNTTLVRGGAPFVDVGTVVGPIGELPSVIDASGNVAPGLSLFTIDDFVNADLSQGDPPTHGNLVNWVESQGFPKPALGIDIAKSGHADEENSASDWTAAFALVAQQLAANPNERAVINISIEGGGETLADYRTAMLDTFRLYARELSALAARDPSLYDRIGVVAIAGNGFGPDGVDLKDELATLHSEFPALFGIGPPVTGPHMLIVGGTKEGSTDINTAFNFSSNPGDMIYAPSENVVVTPGGGKSSGTSYAGPAVSNLLGHILAANPGLGISDATKALLAAFQTKGSLPTLAEVQSEINDFASVSINDVSKNEGNSGTTAYTFTVTLSAPSTNKVSVNYATANGSAAAGSDYIAKTGVVNFQPGQTSKNVTILVKGDKTEEPNETFLVKLSNPKNVAIADGQGVGIIVNDDTLNLKIANVAKEEGNSGTSIMVFTVTLSSKSSQAVTVDYATESASAATYSDYNPQAGSLTFAPGQTSKTITVPIIGDNVVEPDETFTVNLSGASGAIISDNQAIGTILNDDGIKIQGTVTDADTSDPIGGATLLVVQNSQTYTATSSANGGYKLWVPVDLASQTEFVAMQVSAAGYQPKAVSVNLGAGNQTKNVALKPLSDDIVVVETPLHHLGDSYFTTALNAGLQTLTAEGTVFTKTFSLTAANLPPHFTSARLELSINGAESSDVISINGTNIASVNNNAAGPQAFEISFNIALLHAGNNTFRIVSVTDGFGGKDDFEFSNVILRLLT